MTSTPLSALGSSVFIPLSAVKALPSLLGAQVLIQVEEQLRRFTDRTRCSRTRSPSNERTAKTATRGRWGRSVGVSGAPPPTQSCIARDGLASPGSQALS
jgi:hypothetical protein